MQHVYILGVGATPVGELYTRTLNDLALEAIGKALGEVETDHSTQIGALYVANAMGEILSWQTQMGAVLASAAHLEGLPALRIEAAGASGGMALHQATLAIASGAYDVVLVLGAEKVTDRLQVWQESALALATDSDFEFEQGVTLTAQWAMLMRRYMYEYGYTADAFAPFPVNAHANGASNPNAMYRFAINADKYRKAAQIASPLNMFDCASLGDGAAAVVLASERLAREARGQPVRIAASAVATDTLALFARSNPLWLRAAERSASSALQQSQKTHADIDVLDLTDPHGITAALALEACGFVERGSAPRHAADGGIAPSGSTPLATAGGYKARGDAGGATGVYQIVELVQQLRGTAPTQVPNAQVAFAQCLGGVGTTAVTHIVQREAL